MATFVPPIIQDNPDGWGPCAVPDNFLDMPYQPFEKSQRMGKISDWTGNTYQDKRYQNKYNSAFGAGSQYAYYHEEDESTFQLVDTTKTQRPLYQRGRVKFNQQRQQRERRAQINAAKLEILSKSQKSRERDRQRQLRKWQKSYGRQVQENKKLPTKHREASVQVRDSWTVLEEMDFVRLAKLSLPNIGEGTDLYTCGTMEYYDKKYDRVNTKSEKKMKRVNKIFHTVTTTDDPIIRQLAKSKGNVFATDTILTTLMCCTRSVYPWDIVVQRVGNKLFFDKRDDSEFDLLTVSETAVEPPVDDGGALNSPKNLALEATFINHNFTQQVLKSDEEKYSFPNSNPFVQKGEEAEMASVGYRYRRFDIGNDIQLVVRCEHDAVTVGTNGETQFINIKALNEWDSRFCGGVDWRTKLDVQRGAVLATELKNNSFKMAKWTASALLAGSDQIKFGFVSRTHYRDSTRHTVLGMQQFKPSEFALQMNLNFDNAWGILRCLIDFCLKLKEGKYLIMKDPMKPVIRVYDIPDNTFEDEDEDDSEEDEEENSEEDNEDEGEN